MAAGREVEKEKKRAGNRERESGWGWAAGGGEEKGSLRIFYKGMLVKKFKKISSGEREKGCGFSNSHFKSHISPHMLRIGVGQHQDRLA